jgi:hypothetical protein
MRDLQTVIFHEPKEGVPDSDWEDGAGHRAADPGKGSPARLVVLDGAAEAYGAIEWVGQLVASFIGADGPEELNADDLDGWFGGMQQSWANVPRDFRNVFAEHKFRTQGSFATFLGCEVRGLDQPKPLWIGAALGDAVLFHFRPGKGVIAQLPDITAEAFGYNPDGVSTRPSERGRMREGLVFAGAELDDDDVLYLTTDALAHWLLTRDCWADVAAIERPGAFRRWVAEQRGLGMKDDDVTMLRAEVTANDVELLVLCR